MKPHTGIHLASLAMLLLAGLQAPVAGATHDVPRADEFVPPEPQVPARPLGTTDIRPVDHEQDAAVGAANDALGQGHGATNSTFTDAQGTVPDGFLRVYRDGTGSMQSTGPDGRFGGFGPWRVLPEPLGEPVWSTRADAARTGVQGFTVAGADGSYPSNTLSMLVTPELDLQTDFGDPELARIAAAADGTRDNTAAGTDPTLRDILGSLYGIGSPSASALPGTAGVLSTSGLWRALLSASPPPDALVQLQFDARYNLALREDTVQVVLFTQPPAAVPFFDASPTGSCPATAPPPAIQAPGATVTEASCYILSPLEGHGPVQPNAGRPSPAFTGTEDWQTYTLDLTPWAGRSVWVGFVLATFAEAPNRLSHQAGFYGFQLDDLDLTMPAPTTSVRVRTPTSPGYIPPGCAECPPGAPVIAPDTPFWVEGDVLNTGTADVSLRVTTSILDATGAPLPAFTHTDEPIEVRAGRAYAVRVPFAGLDASLDFLYRARVSVERIGPSAQGDDPNPSNDADAVAFAARSVELVTQGPMARSSPSIKLGDEVSFSAPFTNAGTVPVTLVANACVVDLDAAQVNGSPPCGTDLLDFRHVEQEVTLAPGQTHHFQWDAKGGKAGQYRLFVRINDDVPFASLDLVAPSQQPLMSTYFDADGAAAGMPWALARTYPIALSQVDQTANAQPPTPTSLNPLAATLRVLNDDDNLHLRLDLNWPFKTGVGATTPDNRAEHAVSFRFTRPGIPLLQAGAADSTRIDGAAWTDQHLDPTSLDWVPDAQGHGPVPSRAWHVNGAPVPANYTYTLSRPLNDGDSQDLAVAPGDLLGIFLEATRDTQAYRFPIEASDRDGGSAASNGVRAGLGPPDGRLDDELATWQLIRLGKRLAEDPGKIAYAARIAGPGFGVERSPAPFYAEEFQDCGNVLGWSQSGVARSGTQSQKWNCAPYGPEGRSLLYVGISPDSTCTGPCPPYDRIGNDGQHAVFSPPIKVAEVAEPYLFLKHQYSTDARIIDEGGLYQDASGIQYSDPLLRAQGKGRVYMERLDPSTGAWSDRVMLVPDAGYTTQAQVGIVDPNTEPRLMGGGSPPSSACGTQLPLPVPAATQCGFWWPTGPQPYYKPAGAAFMEGKTFGGSPWLVDRFRLHGTGLNGSGTGSADTAASNQTVRFMFSWTGNSQPGPFRTDPYAAPGGLDYGWRIGGIAIQEGATFQRDLSVDDVDVKATLYDPVALGLGPGIPIPVVVQVSNHGELDARALRVEVEGFDATRPDAPVLCRAPTFDVALLVPAGSSGNLTAQCVGTTPTNPGLPDGTTVSFRASVTALAGDDFPTDNSRTSTQAYAVRSVPDAAIRLDASPRTSSQDTPRQVFLVLENRGNVPLRDVNVTLATYLKQGAQNADQVRQSPTWQVVGEVPVGGAYNLDDRNRLNVTPLVRRDTDLTFLPPDAGSYEIVARVTAAGDPGGPNDVAVVAVQARNRLYDDSLDAQPFAANGVVSGERLLDSTSVWRIDQHSLDGSNRLLAGDPATDEIPHGTDASVLLPDLDLTTVRSATLTFVHRYDLEPSFDAARVEISTDGGATWRSVSPVPQPLAGLPDGYPSSPLLGASPFLAGEAELQGVAFTGRSEDLPGSGETGWMTAEFDLSQDPGLRRTSDIESFRLDGFAPRPAPAPKVSGDGVPQFRHDSWTLNETGAEANRRYWWVDDLAADVKPHSGGKMWWSGSGSTKPDNGPQGNAGTDLRYEVGTIPSPTKPNERILFSFWDWRPGMEEGDATDRTRTRYGTGGDYTVATMALIDGDGDGLSDLREGPGNEFPQFSPSIPDSDGDGLLDGAELCGKSYPNPSLDIDGDGLPGNQERNYCTSDSGNEPTGFDTDWDAQDDGREVAMGSDPNTPFLMGRAMNLKPGQGAKYVRDFNGALLGPPGRETLAVEADGWTKREVDLTPFTGQSMTLWFQYHSSPLPDPLRSTAGDLRSQNQNNLGWFIDDIALTSVLVDPSTGLRTGQQVIASDDLEGLDPDNTGAAGSWSPFRNSQGNAAAPRWTLVGQSAAATRPTGWNVAIVQIPGEGDVPAWRFSGTGIQGYPKSEESRLVTPLVDLTHSGGTGARLQFDQRYAFESVLRCPLGADCATYPGAYLAAVDGGAVEYQVYDPATSTFGPWQQLGARFRDFPDRLLFEADGPFVERVGTTTCTPASTTGECGRRRPMELSDDAAIKATNFAAIRSTGYSAVFEHGHLVDPHLPNARNPHIVDTFNPTAFARTPLGLGAHFETWPGQSRNSWIAFDRTRIDPWSEAPVSYAFSGVSPGVQGWQAVDWDVSPLLGEKVRFAFHVASNPSIGSDSALAEVPSHQRGWTIANVAVKSDVFDGKPTQLRLRLATDGTVTKGEWSVDSINIVGDRYSRNAAILADGPQDILVTPGTPVTLDGHVANLGTASRAGLAIGVSATDLDTKEDVTSILTLQGDADPPMQPLTTALPDGVELALGPFSLQAGDAATGRIVPFRVLVPAADDTRRIGVRVVLLEQQGGKYTLATNEVAGSSTNEWTVHSDTSLAIHLAQPLQGVGSLVVAQPSLPEPHGPVTLKAAVRNDGTSVSGLKVEWTLEEVVRKGDPVNQPGTKAEDVDLIDRETRILPMLAQQSTLPIQSSKFTLGQAGLYRGTVRIFADGVEQARSQFEFLVGQDGRYHSIDFGSLQESEGLGGWNDSSPAPTQQGKGTPPSLRFRRDGGQMIWGVSDAHRLQDFTYCSSQLGAQCDGPAVVCNPSCNSVAPIDYFGLDGTAVSPVIDLSRVPQGSAVMALRYGLDMHSGDGVLVEAMPLKAGSAKNPRPAFLDCNGDPAWFILNPRGGADHGELASSIPSATLPMVPPSPGGSGTVPPEETPNRLHPLSPGLGRVQPIFGGARVKSETLYFSLDGPALPASVNTGGSHAHACAQSTVDGALVNSVNLINYSIQLRLHVGTVPGYFAQSPRHDSQRMAGGHGLQVESIELSSTGLAAAPASREVPMVDGAAKRLGFQLTNLGQVPDEVQVSLDSARSSLPDASWVHLPTAPVSLEPGQRTTVLFDVDIPADAELSRGTYVAHLVAQSLRSPTTLARTELAIVLGSNPVPDLAVDLSTDAPADPPTYQVGTRVPVFAVVSNVGALASKPAAIRFSTFREGSNDTVPLDSAQVPTLCPLPQCGPGSSRASSTIEWLVPDLPGNYVVRAEVDAEGRNVDSKRANNVDLLRIRAVPVQAPDVAITSLTVGGVGPDGYAEKGVLLALRANVTNLGFRPAAGVQVRLLAGSSELTSVTLPALQPGEARTVTAFKIASPGETVMRAIAVPSPSELRVDNNEFRRIVRGRDHDLSVALDPHEVSLDPDTVATAIVAVANNGTTVEQVVVSVAERAGWAFSVSPNPVLVAPRGQALAVLTMRAPADAPSGLHLLDVTAVPTTNAGAGAHGLLRANVTATLGAPSIAVAPLATMPGAANVTVAVQSASNAGLDLRVILSRPEWAHTPSTFRLHGGSNRTVELPVTVPVGTPPGDHAIEVQALDGSGKAVAQASATLRVLARQDVEASWLGAPSLQDSGVGARSLQLDLRVANTGNVPVLANAIARDLPPGVTVGMQPSATAIDPGAETVLRVGLILPADAPKKLHGRVEVAIQGATAQGFGNATVARTLGLPDPSDAPDLRIAHVDVFPRGTPTAGQTVRVLLDLENAGGVDSPPTRLRAFANGELFSDPAVPRIPAGGHVAVNLTMRFDETGTYLLTFVADGEGKIAELAKDNNDRSLPVEVREPDLLSAKGVQRRVPGPDLGLLALALAAFAALASRRREGHP